MTRDERNATDVVPVQAGISVFQHPAKVDFIIFVFVVMVIHKKLTAVILAGAIKITNQESQNESEGKPVGSALHQYHSNPVN
jgi:hypothetical protein